MTAPGKEKDEKQTHQFGSPAHHALANPFDGGCGDDHRGGNPENGHTHPANRAFTSAETLPPSVRPAARARTIFITPPISFIEVAPSSAITSSTSAASSSSLSGAGR